MFKDWKFLLIISLVAVIVLLILFWPSKQPDQDTSEAFKSEIERLKVEKAENSLKVERLKKTYSDSLRIIEALIYGKDKEITLFRRKLADLRPVVAPQLDSLPLVKQFVDLQDSVIQAQGKQIDTLKWTVEFQKKMFAELVAAEVDEEKIDQRIQAEQAKRIDELEKANEKMFKKKTFWQKVAKATIVIAVVETAILILQ